ncbi:hypothetical protein BaRGS_00024306, partial [Batillaria attramentaria]
FVLRASWRASSAYWRDRFLLLLVLTVQALGRGESILWAGGDIEKGGNKRERSQLSGVTPLRLALNRLYTPQPVSLPPSSDS